MRKFLPYLSGTGAFTPLSIYGLVIWLDASDASTIVLNGSAVSQWSDKSGQGNNLTQATSSNQPTYNASTTNGKGGVIFNAVGSSGNNILANPSVVAAGNGCTVFSVTSIPSYNNYGRLTSFASPSTANDYDNNKSFTTYIRTDEPSNPIGLAHAGILITGAIFNLSQAYVFSSIVNDSSGNSSIYTNGILGAETADVATGTTAGSFALGASATTPTPNFFSSCIHSEVLVFHRALTTAERQSLESYLMTKWGVTL